MAAAVLAALVAAIASGSPAFAAVGSAFPPGTNPCAVVTRADASAALGVAARPGFAIGANRTNISLGGPITGPNVTCRYRSSVGEVYLNLLAYGDAASAYERNRQQWFPVMDLTGIGDAAFYTGGGQIYVRKGRYVFMVSLTFKKIVNRPRQPDPRLIALAKKAASRL